MTSPVPVTVLSGFLGSGKTTLLNTLLGDPAVPPTALVINEFGDVALDQHFLGDAGRDAWLLPNGCLCCVVRDDLSLTLQDIAAEQAGRFEQMVIETSGIANPAPLLSMLMTDPALVSRYRINGVVTLVDLQHGAATLRDYPEARAQVAVADRIFLTKTDLASADQAMAARSAVRALSSAPQWTAPPGPDDFFALSLFDGSSGTMRPDRWMFRNEPAAHHAHGSDICAYRIALDDAVAFAVLQDWLELIARLFGAEMLRLKGLVRLAETPETAHAIHGVQGSYHPPVPAGDASLTKDGGTVVMIGPAAARPLLSQTLATLPGGRLA